MKTNLTRIVLVTAMLSLVAVPALANTAMGVVNVQKIMRDSKAAQSVRAQLQAKQKASRPISMPRKNSFMLKIRHSQKIRPLQKTRPPLRKK
jgi:hypothetical protein